jgi:glycerate dehydrogenase
MAKKSLIKILFLDAATVDLDDLQMESLKKQGYYKGLALKSQEPLPSQAAQAQVLISNKYILGEEQFENLPCLKLVCVAATGVNNVDLVAAKKRGIAVCNVVGYSTPTVVEHALLFLLAFSHRLLEHHDAVVKGHWSRGPYYAFLNYPYHDLRGKKLGILGYGNIGRGVAKVAKELGMEILIGKIPGRKYSKKRIPLNVLLKKSDFVTLNCPLSPQTYHLINQQKLRLMKPTAYLLNLARGPIVVEQEVARALKKGIIAGYASDVTEQEPPSLKHPLLDPAISDKVILTPHIAWASQESRQRMVEEIAKNIQAFKNGKKRNRVE